MISQEIYPENEIDLNHISKESVENDILKIIKGYKLIPNAQSPIEMKIILQDEETTYEGPRRLSPLEKAEVNKQIEKWLKDGIFHPSVSEFARSIVLVNKKDGSKRICCDFRRLNKKILKDRFPLPIIDEQIDKLQNAKVFTTLDLENGYFHVPVNSDSIIHCFRYSGRNCNYQFDDLVISAENKFEGLGRLKMVLQVAERFGLRIKWKKCQFVMKKIKYLGHQIENGTIKPSIEKTSVIRELHDPSNTKQIQNFVGLANYFRRFIENFSVIPKPLTDLLTKDRSLNSKLRKESF